MKKITAVLALVAILCFSFISCSSEQIFSGNTDIKYKIENGEAVVTEIPNKSIVTSVVIPDEYEGVPVTKICNFSATNLEYLTEISIGKNVREIEAWAFGNSKKIKAFKISEENPYLCDVDGVIYTKDMKTILFYPPSGGVKTEKDADGNEVKSISYEIPEGVETIRTKAFYKCYDLTEIKFPSTLKVIEEKAFFSCKIKELSLPEGLEAIGKDAFAFCEAIEKFTIPSSVTRIDEYAFYSCASVSEITMLCKEDNVTLGKKWYPTKNGVEFGDALTIKWENE